MLRFSSLFSGILIVVLFLGGNAVFAQSGNPPPASPPTGTQPGGTPTPSGTPSNQSGSPTFSPTLPFRTGIGGISQSIDLSAFNYSGAKSAEDVSAKLIRLLAGVSILVAILVFMIGSGFWIFSAGNESLVERGKDMMMYSGIGLSIVLLAFVLVSLVQYITYIFGT